MTQITWAMKTTWATPTTQAIQMITQSLRTTQIQVFFFGTVDFVWTLDTIEAISASWNKGALIMAFHVE